MLRPRRQAPAGNAQRSTIRTPAQALAFYQKLAVDAVPSRMVETIMRLATREERERALAMISAAVRPAYERLVADQLAREIARIASPASLDHELACVPLALVAYVRAEVTRHWRRGGER